MMQAAALIQESANGRVALIGFDQFHLHIAAGARQKRDRYFLNRIVKDFSTPETVQRARQRSGRLVNAGDDKAYVVQAEQLSL